jgi:hypothetical protein
MTVTLVLPAGHCQLKTSICPLDRSQHCHELKRSGGLASQIVNPAPNFDHLVRPYRWLEHLTFGSALQRCRTHFLPQLANCRNALILGDGDGRFTARLLEINPNIRVHAIDFSPVMLQVLEEFAGPHADRVTTEVADLRSWQPSNATRYDLIVTHFFLDCLTADEIGGLARCITPALSSNAIWLVSDFAIPDTLFGRAFAAPLVAMLYRAFRVLTGLRVHRLPNHQQALECVGWSIYTQSTRLNGLLISQIWHRHSSRKSP